MAASRKESVLLQGLGQSAGLPEHLYVPSLHEERETACDASEIARELAAYGVPIELLACGRHEDVAAELKVRIAAQLRTPPDARFEGKAGTANESWPQS